MSADLVSFSGQVEGPHRRGGRWCPAFSLVEVLVVAAIIALLTAILVPGLGRARLQARVTLVRAELHQVASALEIYHHDWKDYPWAWSMCFGGGVNEVYRTYNPLPPELGPLQMVNGQKFGYGKGYLGDLGPDPFNPAGHTYKYARDIGYNNGVGNSAIALWVPKAFPFDRADSDPAEDYIQDGLTGRGIVEYAVWSVGPSGDRVTPNSRPFTTSVEACEIYRLPVPRRGWYSFQNGRQGPGVIPLIKSRKHGFVQWADPGTRTVLRKPWEPR